MLIYEQVQVLASLPQFWPIPFVPMPLTASKQCNKGFDPTANYGCNAIYSVSCGFDNTLALKAKDAAEPVAINLSSRNINQLQATAPVQLSNSNNYQAGVKLQAAADYAVHVSPALDGRDYVASFS